MEKKEISLVVCDIDNTLCDTFNVWGNALDQAIDELSALHQMKRSDMEQVLLAAVPENRKGLSGPMIGINLATDIEQTTALHGTTPEEKKHYAKEHAKIVHNWQKTRDKAVLYDGVLPMMRKIKESGAKIVLYTDAREAGCLPRLAKLGIPPAFIDGVYVQPDEQKQPVTPFTVKSDLNAYKASLEEKIVRLPPRSVKPNAKNMKRILQDMGIADAGSVLVVGDNIRADGGCAAAVGAEFAWQKKGTEVSEQTSRCYAVFASNPDYKIGTEAHLSQLTEKNKPSVVLSNGFVDLAKYYRFVAKEKTRQNDPREQPSSLTKHVKDMLKTR